MCDPEVDEIMVHVRRWLDMPINEAKQSMWSYMMMRRHDGFGDFDFLLLKDSETVEEAIGCVFGI